MRGWTLAMRAEGHPIPAPARPAPQRREPLEDGGLGGAPRPRRTRRKACLLILSKAKLLKRRDPLGSFGIFALMPSEGAAVGFVW
jgi:hypothetical protein